jgi:hypothetical protein
MGSEENSAGTTAPFVYHRFPGDDALPEGSLAAADTAPGRGVPFVELLSAGARAFGQPLGSPTKERWRRLRNTAYTLDRLLDNSPHPAEALAIYQQIFASGEISVPVDVPRWVRPDVRPSGALLKSSLEKVSGRRRIAELALETGAYAAGNRAERNVFAYARNVVAENLCTASMVGECMSDAERAAPAFPAFGRWVGEFVASFALVDAVRDLPDDFDLGRVLVRPTRLNRIILMGYTLRAAAILASGRPRATAALAVALSMPQLEMPTSAAQAHRK